MSGRVFTFSPDERVAFEALLTIVWEDGGSVDVFYGGVARVWLVTVRRGRREVASDSPSLLEALAGARTAWESA